MQKIKKFLINNFAFVIVFIILVVPVISLAQNTGLVPCNNSVGGTPCDFNALMAMVNKVINFILKDMAIPIAAIMFFYAGFELVTSGGSTEKRGIAKKVFTNTVIGLILAVAAFLIVKLILTVSGYSGTWIGF